MKKKSWGRVHRGFHKSLISVWTDVKQEILRLRTNNQSVWFTGHSLGGALAQLAVTTLFLQEKKVKVGGLYTFGQPKIGNSKFRNTYNAHLKSKTYRVVNNNDLVARIPTINYWHVEQLIYFSSKGKLYRDKELTWWEMKIDKIKGKTKAFLKLDIDALKDHKMDNYQELCKKALK